MKQNTIIKCRIRDEVILFLGVQSWIRKNILRDVTLAIRNDKIDKHDRGILLEASQKGTEQQYIVIYTNIKKFKQ